ncbi:MAG: hypothetical protein KatS3mg039_0257 [Candidatus Kapaibacterium sp.]|nr:MAG: hypothetical protein KatS3mg039_0257 [Candidatus Kapabacteria bacterium]
MRGWEVKNALRILAWIGCTLVVVSGVSARLWAQGADTAARYRILNSEGTEFWLCFMKNFREEDPNKPGSYEPASLEVFITAEDDADVLLEIPALGFRHSLRIKGGTIGSVPITPEAELDTFPRIKNRALHIQSTAPISVYALNHRIQTTDTYLALPVSVLGTEYRAFCYSKLSAVLAPLFAIIATEDDTQVEITPTTPTTDRHGAYERYTITLDRGQVYQVRAQYFATGTGDLTGTLIKATKPIAVFSGHTCAYVPPGTKACNHLVEQLPPISAWGKQYYIGKLRGRSRYTYRILASQDRTRVFKDQTLIAILNAGEYYEEPNATDHVQLSADKPILVAQYSQGFGNGDEVGDPMMILISPTQQFVDRYRIATPVQGSWDHYVNIVAREEAIGTIRLDGRPIPATSFERIGISSYFVAHVRLSYGTHTITGDEPFGLYSYGFGYRSDAYDAYGTMGGQTFFVLDTLRDRLPPQSAFQITSQGKALRVIVRDDRPTDSGLDSITPLQARNLRAYLPRIERGQPQAEFNVHPLDLEQDGQLVLALIDAAGNRSVVTYTYCYNHQRRSFEFTSGFSCPPRTPWHLGLWGTANAVYHTSSLSATGEIRLPRPTSNAYGGAIGISVSGGYSISDALRLTARLSLQPFAQYLAAPDTSTTHIRLANDSLVVVQAETRLIPRAPMLAIGIGAEWVLLTKQSGSRIYELYLSGGLQGAIPLSSAFDLERRFVLPSPLADAIVPGTMTAQRDAATAAFIPELYGGFGFAAPIPHTQQWTATLAVQYVLPLGSVLRDATWTVERLQLALGLRYSF